MAANSWAAWNWHNNYCRPGTGFYEKKVVLLRIKEKLSCILKLWLLIAFNQESIIIFTGRHGQMSILFHYFYTVFQKKKCGHSVKNWWYSTTTWAAAAAQVVEPGCWVPTIPNLRPPGRRAARVTKKFFFQTLFLLFQDFFFQIAKKS